ncbi:MRNIP protein, partial [Eudromia elegans]|nr:MRNIP protein [Eudromia elegans]
AQFSLFLQVYGEGSALDCRLHVQKLNLLQGEVEEARSWTPRCVEDSVDINKNTAVESEGRSLVQQVGKAEVSRWSKYLDKSNESQEDEVDEESRERQQFCSWTKNAVEGQRKHQNSFPYTGVQELPEENGAFQTANQAKKRKQCSLAVLNQGDGAAGCGDRMIPASCETAVPQGNTQAPAPSIKPSKWEKFLSFSDNCSETTAKVTLPPQEGSRKLGPPSTAADIFMAGKYSRQAGHFLLPGLGDREIKECLATTEQFASKLPGTTVPGTSSEDVLFKEPQGPLIRAGSAALDSTAGRGSEALTVMSVCPPAPTLVLSPLRLKPGSTSHKFLFCTGEEFDDNL